VFGQIYVQVDTATAVERNAQRLYGVSEQTMMRISTQMELPDDAFIYSGFAQFDELLDFIVSIWKKPALSLTDYTLMERQREADRLITAASMKHSLDLALRRIIAEIVRRAAPEQRKQIAAELSHHKQMFLASWTSSSHHEEHNFSEVIDHFIQQCSPQVQQLFREAL